MITSDECYNYGSSGGCDMGCPVLLAGNCPTTTEVLTGIEKDEERAELMDLYGIETKKGE